MTATMPQTAQNDWVKTVLFDRGYLARIRGEAIKVYLAIIEASGGLPDRSVTISLSQLIAAPSCPARPSSIAWSGSSGSAWSSPRRDSAAR